MTEKSTAFIEQLESIIRQRLSDPTGNSYTASLADAGVKRIAQKLGEEAVELALASVAGDREEVINEAADLMYHLLVLLNVQQVGFADIADVLEQRHGPQMPIEQAVD